MAIAELAPEGTAAGIVAAGTPFGQGSVTVIGFASRFSDSNMGVTGDMQPDATLRAVYQFEFDLLRRILNVPAPKPPATAPATTQP